MDIDHVAVFGGSAGAGSPQERPARYGPYNSIHISPFISELILHAQLDHSIAAATEDFARVRIRQAPITSVRNRSRRRAEVEMVERVQKIGAKLYSMPLGDGYGLLHSNIPVPGAWPI